MDALVTDVHLRSAVTGVRALGRAGLDVVALGFDRRAAGAWSRFAAKRAVGPDVRHRPAEFAHLVGTLSVMCGPLVVYPGWEEAISAVVTAWDSFPPAAVLPYPGPQALRALRDKRSLAERAGEAGIPSPAVVATGTAAELAAWDGDPAAVAVKPAEPGGALVTAQVVSGRDEYRALLGSLPPSAPIVLQERAEGPLLSVGLVLDRDGRVAKRFMHRATRTWPAAAGSSAYAVSIEPDEALIDRIASMMRDAGYWGLAEVELVETEDGPRTIDFNPRFYGCMPLPLRCGVNLPLAWHRVVLGEDPGRPEPYRLGVTYRWLEADLVAAVRGRPRELFRPTPRPRVGGSWSSDDPLPGLMLALDGVGVRLVRRVPGRKTA